MKKHLLWVASAALFYCQTSLAQTPGTVTSHAFVIGKGAGNQGYTSLLCGAAQLAVGQSAADPICRTITGDVTIDATGATTIGSAKVTLSKIAAGVASGDITYWNGSAWIILSGNASGTKVLQETSSGVPSWATVAGTGTVTSSGTPTAGQIAQFTSSTDIKGMSPAPITNSLGADVALSTSTTYFTGPTIAQGTTGTWWVSGTVTLSDSSAVVKYDCKLWDGTTVIASGETIAGNASGSQPARTTMTLSGYLVSPAANIRISCANQTDNTGIMSFNLSGNSKDSTISAHRIQ